MSSLPAVYTKLQEASMWGSTPGNCGRVFTLFGGSVAPSGTVLAFVLDYHLDVCNFHQFSREQCSQVLYFYMNSGRQGELLATEK